MATSKKTIRPFQVHFSPQELPPSTWARLGEVAMAVEQLRTAVLPVQEGRLMNYIALLQGVVANASLDGNTLTADQVDRLLEGSLQLPHSQVFQEREVRNLLAAVTWLETRLKTAGTDAGSWTLQMLHAQVMQGLPSPSGQAPGTFRLGPPELPVPADQLGPAIDHLVIGAQDGVFHGSDPEERLAFGILGALVAHLHLAWLCPFPDGSGRTVRLLELSLLLQAGLPPVAAHRMVAQAADAPDEYARLTRWTGRSEDGVPAFINFMVRGFAERLKALAIEVAKAQEEQLVPEILQGLVGPQGTTGGERLNLLMRELHSHRDEVATAELPLLSPELARRYARLHAKTLQRDLSQLEKLGLVERSRGAVRAKPLVLRPFAAG